jgi:hypothetical protein
MRVKEQAGGMKSYTAQQIADGAKRGVWMQQNRQSGAMPANLPATQSDPTVGADSGGLANVTFHEVRPSNNLVGLQHSAFRISYPENWQASGDRQSAVSIAPRAGVAEGAIGYGVVNGGAQDQNANSLDQAVADLVQALQQSNPGLRVSSNPRVIQVSGLGRQIDKSHRHVAHPAERQTSPRARLGSRSATLGRWFTVSGIYRSERRLWSVAFHLPTNDR